MFSHSTDTASFFSVLMAALIFSLSLAGVAWAQGNTSLGAGALQNNTTGNFNTAVGLNALLSNTTGSRSQRTLSTYGRPEHRQRSQRAPWQHHWRDFNTATGVNALITNTTGDSEHRHRTQCAL